MNGIDLHIEEHGSGEPVVLVAGSGAPGRTWRSHQVPALSAAGYRVISVDNRGIPPSTNPALGMTLDDIVADTAGLIDYLGLKPCRIVGASLGAIAVQELLLKVPGLVRQAVLIATRGRTGRFAAASAAAAAELSRSGLRLPPKYEAYIRALRNLSPCTLADDQKARDWLELFEVAPYDPVITQAHLGLEVIGNRLESYKQIQTQCLVMAFGDDLVAPPSMCREVADAIPHCTYREISGCGHYGYLEDPARVNSAILDFFGQGEDAVG